MVAERSMRGERMSAGRNSDRLPPTWTNNLAIIASHFLELGICLVFAVIILGVAIYFVVRSPLIGILLAVCNLLLFILVNRKTNLEYRMPLLYIVGWVGSLFLLLIMSVFMMCLANV
jgi:hypothetical protein